MTPEELAQVLATLRPYGLRPERLAEVAGYRSRGSIAQMLEGNTRVPPALAEWLRGLHAWHAAHPPPQLGKPR
ncbi:hypothetical protein UFOVP326_67 [uncultured Caudovirales phage]|uniref:Uncharacterized protein n=1 Tax=uncultured Caudovirales phage TaxID=2100421 RepID=A0A6J5M164_9CAUD|nr:hypothetical protein UFOVP326_67 [uncultured Caudovirales phage]